MSWDGYGAQIFPADMLRRQDTLEAVLHQQPPMTTVVAPLRAPGAAAPVVVDAGVHGAAAAAAATRRRPFRTDRHSKIRTAQGVRDRRMRLSVGVAREFFALQDRLGFDKASKTVNWLLTQSKPAIDRLHDGGDLPAAAAASVPAAVVKGMRGEGSSSSSTFCLEDPWDKGGRSRGGRDGPAAAVTMEHGGGNLEWITAHAGAAAVSSSQPPQPMDELEYCYQYYLQLGEMMRCNNNAGGPR